MDLEDLLKKSGELQALAAQDPHKRKKQRSQDEGEPFFPVLHYSLHKIWETVQSISPPLDISRVEVEVRVGHILIEKIKRWKAQINKKNAMVVQEAQLGSWGLSFKAGVDDIYVEHLKRVLISDRFSVEQKPVQRLRIEQSGTHRWEVDATNKVTAVESKNRFFRHNCALMAHQYDIRIDAASEDPRPVADAPSFSSSSSSSGDAFNPDAWGMERVKRRRTYRCKIPNGSGWKIDLTEVENRRNKAVDARPQTTDCRDREIELEFELENREMQSWLRETDEKKARDKALQLASRLHWLIELCVPSETEVVGELPMGPLPAEVYLSGIYGLNDMLKRANSPTSSAPAHAREHLDFVGSMPINLTRRNLLTVQRNGYFLTEKSDGVRYLLYVVASGGAVVGGAEAGQPVAVLMDRACHVFNMHGSAVIGAALGVGAVLDGELVYNRLTKESVFLVFDMLALDGRPFLHLPFRDRLRAIREQVIPRCAKIPSSSSGSSSSSGTGGSSGGSGGHPIPKLIRKNFVEKHRFCSDLLSRIQFKDGERMYDDGERQHKSDGIIFQPDSPYVFGRDTDLLKWKWPELRSVDVQIVVTKDAAGPQVRLFCNGPEGTLIDLSKRGNGYVGLGIFDTQRLLADVDEALESRRQVIVEVAYDPMVGLWSYLHGRADKKDPNFIDAVLGVFVEQAEAISVEELQYKMLAKAEAEDDYGSQMARMKAKLLLWQAEEAKKTAGGAGKK